MFSRYTTEAFVLEARPRGEADYFYLFFSKEFGLVEVMARSVRKIDSKLRGDISPLSLSLVEFIQGRYFKILTYAEGLDDLSEVKENLVRLRTGYKMRNLFQRMVRHQERDEALWRHLVDGFEVLSDCPRSLSALYLTYFSFAWRLLILLGYKPDLSREEMGDVDPRILDIVRESERRGPRELRCLSIGEEDVEELERVVAVSLPDGYNTPV